MHYTHSLTFIYFVLRINYGVATMSRRLKMIGLFGRISSLLEVSFAKETYNFKEPTNRSHPIRHNVYMQVWGGYD